MKKILTLLLSTVLIASCATTNTGKNTSNPDSTNEEAGLDIIKIKKENYQKDSLLVRLELGACFGNCPVEKFSIYASGHFRYEGINFVKKMGKFKGNLKEKEVNEIYTLISKLKMEEYPEKFGFAVSDISTKALVFNFGQNRKKIMFKQYQGHTELRDFINRLRAIMGGAKYVGDQSK